jgi:stage III sporulation protein SpoIIIAA
MTLYLNTTDVYGVHRDKKFTVQVVDLTLTAYEETIFKSTEDIFSYSCIVGGAKTGISNKKLVVSVYTEDNLNAPAIP